MGFHAQWQASYVQGVMPASSTNSHASVESQANGSTAVQRFELLCFKLRRVAARMERCNDLGEVHTYLLRGLGFVSESCKDLMPFLMECVRKYDRQLFRQLFQNVCTKIFESVLLAVFLIEVGQDEQAIVV